MELQGTVCNGVIVLNGAVTLPEGTLVRVSPASVEKPKSFGERFSHFKGTVPGLPADLAKQHEH